MKVFKSKIIIQIILIILPFLATPIVVYYNSQAFNGIKNILIKKYFSDIITDVEIIISSLKINSNIVVIAISMALSYLLLVKFRAWNQNKYVNKGNNYIDCSYAYFFIAGRILNYSKINLVRIPIWLQYSIIIADTFDQIIYSEDLDIDSNEASVKIFDNNKDFSKVNLVIEDTYTISIEQIPEAKRDFPLIIISRANVDGRVRKYSKSLVNLVLKKVYEYENELSELNIYATTNTKHNYEIAEKCFKTGNRSSNYKLKIYQQSSEGKRMFTTPYSIKK